MWTWMLLKDASFASLPRAPVATQKGGRVSRRSSCAVWSRASDIRVHDLGLRSLAACMTVAPRGGQRNTVVRKAGRQTQTRTIRDGDGLEAPRRHCAEVSVLSLVHGDHLEPSRKIEQSVNNSPRGMGRTHKVSGRAVATTSAESRLKEGGATVVVALHEAVRRRRRRRGRLRVTVLTDGARRGPDDELLRRFQVDVNDRFLLCLLAGSAVEAALVGCGGGELSVVRGESDDGGRDERERQGRGCDARDGDRLHGASVWGESSGAELGRACRRRSKGRGAGEAESTGGGGEERGVERGRAIHSSNTN